MLEIHHSGREPSIYFVRKELTKHDVFVVFSSLPNDPAVDEVCLRDVSAWRIYVLPH